MIKKNVNAIEEFSLFDLDAGLAQEMEDSDLCTVQKYENILKEKGAEHKRMQSSPLSLDDMRTFSVMITRAKEAISDIGETVSNETYNKISNDREIVEGYLYADKDTNYSSTYFALSRIFNNMTEQERILNNQNIEVLLDVLGIPKKSCQNYAKWTYIHKYIPKKQEMYPEIGKAVLVGLKDGSVSEGYYCGEGNFYIYKDQKQVSSEDVVGWSDLPNLY